MYRLGGVAGDATRSQTWSVGMGYNRGPPVLGAGYMNVRNSKLTRAT
jgi:hypothetical protein